MQEFLLTRRVSFCTIVRKACLVKNEIILYIPHHAEFNVIRAYIKNTDRSKRHLYTMVVIRKNKEGILTESKPCTFCLNMLKIAGIRKIIYSTKEGILCKSNTDDIIDTKPSSFFGTNNIDCDKEAINRRRGL